MKLLYRYHALLVVALVTKAVIAFQSRQLLFARTRTSPRTSRCILHGLSLFNDNDDENEHHASLDRLLDSAVLLYSKALERENTVWLAEQAESLIHYMSHRRQRLRCHSSSSPTDIALEIDKALLNGDDTSKIDALVKLYQEAKDASLAAEGWKREVNVVQRQLQQFHSLLRMNEEEGKKKSAVVLEQENQQPRIQRKESSAPPEATTLQDTVLGGSSTSTASPPPSSSTIGTSRPSPPRGTALRAFTTNTGDDLMIDQESDDAIFDEQVDIAIIGAGIAGLAAGAILNVLYGKKVGVYESHYLPGGCAHAFERKSSKNGVTFTFDSGPTILLGCSSPPYNALRQVLDAIDESVDWIPYDGWGMIENPGKENEIRWKMELGRDVFEQGPLKQFGGERALEEFLGLQEATKGLLAGVSIPAMAMRPGAAALIPLLRYFPTLISLLSQGETLTGTFAPFMDGPLYRVTDPWLRNWLDALAFSLSGLPASRTAAAAMAFILYDMHREGAALDYPRGGMGEIIDALVRGVQKGSNGSKVHLRQHVKSIDFTEDATRTTGITLRNGKRITARDGVICNAPVWSLKELISDDRALRKLNNNMPVELQRPPSSWKRTEAGSSLAMERALVDSAESLLEKCDTAEQTGSFLHLHLALDANGLDMDNLEAHYTVMDRGLAGDGRVVNGVEDGPCGELNMIAVSNPCKLDKSLAPEGYVVVHAYGAGNEPYEVWEKMDRASKEYQRLKVERAQVLWRAVESVIPDARKRAVLELIGSPITHERFLRRPRGTYGSATEDYLRDGSTPFDNLVLANDGVFPGIGVPSVCIAGASAANAFASVLKQWQCLDSLKL